MRISDLRNCYGIAFSMLLWTGCNSSQGAPKYPVTGQVLVNGEPASYVMVRFHAPGQGLVAQDAQPAAVADEEGRFALSSFGNADGAAAADYVVTFYWPQTPLIPSDDRLQGEFSNPGTSQYSISVTSETGQLPPFELEIDPKRLLPANELPIGNLQ